MNKQERFLATFGRFGFNIVTSSPNRLVGYVKGPTYGVTLEIYTGLFTVKIDDGILEQFIFYWQGFTSYEEITKLLMLNAVLVQQLAQSPRKRAKTLSSKAEQHGSNL